jgi:hypothetical protein
MKRLLSAAALAAILSTPALADKMPVKPDTKPLNTCNEKLMLKQMVYHLDQIEMMIAQMRKDALRQYPKKPVKDAKTSG